MAAQLANVARATGSPSSSTLHAKVRGAVESYGSTGALPLRATLDKLHTSLLLA
ncbi:hypothetical protein GCM10020229_60490 [Kitasatospora albolonga]